jgi:hypothetical protein
MSLRNINTLVLLAAIVLASCAKIPVEDKPVRLEKQKLQVLEHVLDSLSHLRVDRLYTKMKCNYSDTNQRLSFKTSIRLVKDSIINPLITFASIPIVNAIMRPDSLIISNRKDKCYIKTTMDYIQETFGVDFEYKNMEELLLGLPIAYKPDEKYFIINDPFNYIISSHRKSVIKKETKERTSKIHDKLLKKEQEDEPVLIQYYLHPELSCVNRIIIDSPSDTATITLDYLSRDTIQTYLIPRDVLIDIKTKKNHIVLEMNYDKSEVNVPQEIRFIIPEEYEECKLKN